MRAAIVPTMVSTLERADRVALALEARHYRVRPLQPAPPGALPWRLAGLALFGTALLWRR
jgi:energy-coupling factor transporter transmembrane protein EcfT